MKIVWIGTAIGDYRQAVLDLLIESLGDRLVVITGPSSEGGAMKMGIKAPGTLRVVRNFWLLGNRFYFQSGVLGQGLRARVLLMESNPRNLSNWFLLLARKILRRKTVLWGHAWSKSGQEASSNKLRQKMMSLCDVMVAYTESQATDLRQLLPRTEVIAAPNALYARSRIAPVLDEAGVNSFIYVGRLIASKKPRLLLEAWLLVADQFPAEWKLVFVGEGAERKGLEERVAEAGMKGRVVFVGHESNWDKLRELYSRALASYSPGPVGLAVTQSFAFGVPMGIARVEAHGPEVEAAVEDENVLFFESDDVAGAAATMTRFLSEKELWIARRPEIAEDCSRRYSADLMAERLLQAVS